MKIELNKEETTVLIDSLVHTITQVSLSPEQNQLILKLGQKLNNHKENLK